MSNADSILKVFVPLYLVAYILITYTFNVASFRKKYGIDPRVVQKSDRILYLCQVYRDVIFVVILVMAFVYAFAPRMYAYFVRIPFMDVPALRFTGAAILVGSLVLVRLAQHQLKSSWRIGVDRSGASTELITTGLYAVSRNPIALGMTLTALGLFLALPNAVTFGVLNLTFLLFQVRIRIEEEHLMKTHGAAYEAYRRSTPRWLVRMASES